MRRSDGCGKIARSKPHRVGIDHSEERAATREYEGGQSRQDTETAALDEAAQASGFAPTHIAAALEALRATTSPKDAQRILARSDGLLMHLEGQHDPLDSVRAVRIRNLAEMKGARP